jgi:16S rRNA processing protein RimM
MDRPYLVSVGKAGGAHGIQGAVKVLAYGETLATLSRGAKLFWHAGTPDGEIRELTLITAVSHGRAWLAQFEEIKDREAARAITGKELLIEEDRLPPPAEGEYYQYQLIGLLVERIDGRMIGTLTSIMETGSHDIYVVKDEDREFLIPAVEEFVREIDLQRRRVVIDPPEGLLE